VIVAIHEKLEKFQNISIEDLSENVFYVRKLITEINVKINELSDDILYFLSLSIWLEKRYLQFTQWVPMGSHGFPIFKWVTHGRPMQSSAECFWFGSKLKVSNF
jgi:hypothetical protein